MNNIKLFEEFGKDENKNENDDKRGSMTINDMSEKFVEFYDAINEMVQFMDEGTKRHLKIAFWHLDRAWETEADAHGVDFTKYPVKL